MVLVVLKLFFMDEISRPAYRGSCFASYIEKNTEPATIDDIVRQCAMTFGIASSNILQHETVASDSPQDLTTLSYLVIPAI